MHLLHLEDLHTIVEADAHPVLVRRTPLQLVDFPARSEGEDRVLDGLRLDGDVPDQGLPVVADGAYMTGGMGRPGDAVDGRLVADELGDGEAGHADVEDDRFGGVYNGWEIGKVAVRGGGGVKERKVRIVMDAMDG